MEERFVDKSLLYSRVEAGIDSQNQFYNLFRQAHAGIVIFRGPQLVVELANESLLKIWGKGDDVIGKPLLEALPEIEGTNYPDLLLEVLHKGITHYANENSAYLVRDGRQELVYFNFVYQPLYEPDGRVTGVMATANEVTDQVRARKQVEESERRFRNLVLNAEVATAIYMGEDMVIQLANDAMIRLWGKDVSVIGQRLEVALPELEGQPFMQLLRRVYSTGETYRAPEDRADLVVDGKLQSFYFNFTYKALHNEDGKVYAVLNMAVDVTEQVRARIKLAESEERLRLAVEERTRELKASNESLIRSNQQLEQFAHVASHDMKEPIRKIKLFSNRIQDEFGGALPPRALTYLHKVQSAASRMSMMVEGVLNYSSVTSMKPAIETVDLNGVFRDIETDLELLIHQKGAVINHSTLPSVEGASILLYQLFYNLVNNSLKFSRPGVPPVIDVGWQIIGSQSFEDALAVPGALVEIALRDNGIGFKQQYADEIFNTFTRLHSRDEYEGTGLGLALCKNIVGRHHGSIHADSQVGEGTTFVIRLPEKQPKR